MTFDQFANQGGTADPEELAATKKAADKLFAEAGDSIEVDDVITPGTDPDGSDAHGPDVLSSEQ